MAEIDKRECGILSGSLFNRRTNMDNIESVALNTLLSSLRKRLQKDINDSLKSLQITSVHGHYLTALEKTEEDLNLTELSSVLDVDKANTTRVIAELEDRGLVQKKRQTTSDRRYIVTLTEEGQDLAQKAGKIISETEENYLSAIGEEERVTFYEALDQMIEAPQDD